MEYLIERGEEETMVINGVETIKITTETGANLTLGLVVGIENDLFEIVDIKENKGELTIYVHAIDPTMLIDLTNN